MRRLYQKIYLTIIAALLLVVLIAGAFWRLGASNAPVDAAFDMVGEMAMAVLPPANAPRQAQQETIEHFAQRIDADLTLFDRDLNRIATVGRPIRPPRRHEGSGWMPGPAGPIWRIQLPDERWLFVRPHIPRRHPAFGMVLFLGLIALVVAVAAFPLVRGLTRRIERLQGAVETLGSGNLGARAKVEGKDEVARLAQSFNAAATRIEDLVGAHRLLLANASHELRTPLSRIRLGLELYQNTGDAKYKTQLQQDIAELDFLIEEILLASRLEANVAVQTKEDVDLLALAAEEAARYDNCTVEGEGVVMRGDARLLRRMVRNLLENAKRHGAPPVSVTVRRDGTQAVLEVSDAGSGIPEAERERVFAPFQRLAGDAVGAGLGLSLVRQIARAHGGDAIVAPRPGAASCFRVTLPLQN
ncbi:MAG TPA: HAMP domain-containing sensor histidine kinase [Xanthobacteraceae bacterium]|nr:HAMP domain-containing sensor histidine kinase [Xanthobacteraceae bacterium]